MCRIHFRERHFWDQLEKIISHSSLYRNVNRCDNAGKSLNTSPYVFTLVHATLSLKNPSPKIKFMELDDYLKHFFFLKRDTHSFTHSLCLWHLCIHELKGLRHSQTHI
jgi:hypothetical protein